MVATELGKALAEKGHEIHFISYNQPVRLEHIKKNIFYHEVQVTSYPLFEYAPYELVLSSKLVDVALNEKLDLLHVHYAIPHASAAYMAREILKTKGVYVPIITTLHGTDITLVGKDSSFEPVITFAINQSDAVTAVSESLKQDTFDFFKVTNDIRVISNFICPNDYISHGNEELRNKYAKPHERLVSHISNFREVKRVGDVIKIFAGILKKMDAKLLLVGDGPERRTAEQMCRELGICDHTLFLGKIRYPEEVLAISDLFLLPSETESFGLAALEAMASSVPVISTNAGGLPEVNVQGVSGFMSDVGQVDEMAANAVKILQDDETLNRFSRQAHEQAMKFDIRNILPEYEELYEEVVQKQSFSYK